MLIPLRKGGVTIVDDEDAHFAVAGWTEHEGYVVRFVGTQPRKRSIYLAHEVVGITPEERRAGLVVDHRDRNKLNNCKANLRIIPHKGNHQNVPARGVSEFRGVTRDGDLWFASAKNYFLGRYADELSAARAAEAFRREHMPFAESDPSLDPLGCACRCKVCEPIVTASGYRGVTWDGRRNKWKARCMHKGERMFLGYFDDPTVASEAVTRYREECAKLAP